MPLYELQKRALQLLAAGAPAAAVADRLMISTATVHRWRVRAREAPVLARPLLGPRRLLSGRSLDLLQDIVSAEPQLYLDELRGRLKERSGGTLAPSLSTISRALRCRRAGGLRMSRKLVEPYAQQRSEEARLEYVERVRSLDHEQFIFLDETGKDLRCTERPWGWGRIGRPVYTRRPFRHRAQRVNAIAAIGIGGIIAVKFLTGKSVINGSTFAQWVRRDLAPRIDPNRAVLVLDNAAFHRTAEARAALAGTGARVEFLPAYSPDLSPIEFAFSKIKKHVQRQQTHHANGTPAINSSQGLVAALYVAFEAVSPSDCRGWYWNCGYSVRR